MTYEELIEKMAKWQFEIDGGNWDEANETQRVYAHYDAARMYDMAVTWYAESKEAEKSTR